jgi:hypothetical protein
VSKFGDHLGEEPNEVQAEKLKWFLENLHSPALTALADQNRALAEETFNEALTMYIEGYEAMSVGNKIQAAFHAAKFYAWVQDLDPHARYQLITGLIKHMLDTTRSLKKPAVRGRRIDV